MSTHMLRLVIVAPLLVNPVVAGAVDTWKATSLVGAPTARDFHAAVWTGSKMIVWGGSDTDYNTGGIYDPATDTWTSTSVANPPSYRLDPTAVWTGSKMIVWGGYDLQPKPPNTGGVYDPVTDTWTATSVTNAPSGRWDHTAVWTGSKMIVWGGYSENGRENTGGIYDPATDTWTATSVTNAPTHRSFHTAVWTGSRMVVWGGMAGTYSAPVYLDTGGIYDPTTDTWTAVSLTNAPTGRMAHEAVWTGTQMIVWGGNNTNDGAGDLSTGGVYDPAADSWTATAATGAPTARSAHTAVWTGSRMIVWGGASGSSRENTGGAYDPATDTWTATSVTEAPTPRNSHTAVWTGAKMIAWGGWGGTEALRTGGVYTPVQSSEAGQFFHSVTPCRLVDTRGSVGALGGPALAANTNRDFVVVGHCDIPSTARALSVNLTATAQTAQGHLRLYPGGTTPPNASSLNYLAGQTRANNAIVMLGTEGNVGVRCVQGSGTAHFILDVNGYFE